MEGAVVETNLYVYHGTAGEHALPHRLQNALLDRRDVLAWDSAADDAVLELEARAAGERRDLYPRVPELPPAAGLFLVASLGLGRGGDGLLERHLRGAGLNLDPVAAVDALNGELHVHLREPREDVLPRLLRTLQQEGWILVGDLADGLEDLLFLAARLRPDGERRGRLRQLHRREGDGCFGPAESVEGVGVLQLCDGDDVARHGLVHGDPFLAHEVRDAPETLGGARARVRECLVRAAAAAHDAQDAQPPGERVHKGLEDVGGERALRVAGDLLALLCGPAGAVHGARGATGDHVQHTVYPDHLLHAGSYNGDNEAIGNPFTYPLEHLFGRKLLAFEVLLQ